MITSPVTPAQLARWRSLWETHRASLVPNRIDGETLDAYFRERYVPAPYDDAAFRDVVRENVRQAEGDGAADIACYQTPDGVLVGIDRVSGAFHVECADIGRCVPVWDDLFVRRGLDAKALGSYVLVGQYLALRTAEDKRRLVEKYHLIHEDGAWWSDRENAHRHLIFKDAFYERSDIIGLLFRINKLCMAKVKYFRQNIDRFEPMKYHWREGFVPTALWDADFLRHRASGHILDLRYLQTITVYAEFAALCEELERLGHQHDSKG